MYFLQDTINLRGEVYFPNLDFEKTIIDFGCILNDTEVTRYINVTNNSPMEVNYKWSFLIDGEPITEYHRRVEPVYEEVVEEEYEQCDDECHTHVEDDLEEEEDIHLEGAESPPLENDQASEVCIATDLCLRYFILSCNVRIIKIRLLIYPHKHIPKVFKNKN